MGPGYGLMGNYIANNTRSIDARFSSDCNEDMTQGYGLTGMAGKSASKGITAEEAASYLTDHVKAEAWFEAWRWQNGPVCPHCESDKARTNGIEPHWAMLKRDYQGVYHRMIPKRLHRYIGEFACRASQRQPDGYGHADGHTLAGRGGQASALYGPVA